jgi:protein-S-isoprenylcysteine O-methyltransferase Ste14
MAQTEDPRFLVNAPPPAGLGAKAIAVVCYLSALLGLAALAGLLLLLGLDQLPPRRWLPEPWPWLVNGGWLLGFGLQHSGMARARFKRVWVRLVPPHLERSVYAALAGLVLLGMALTWQTLPGKPLWTLPFWTLGIPLAAAVGLTAVHLRFDHPGLFGLRQVWEQGKEPAPELLQIVGPYRFVRHPLMACTLVMLWAQPVMTPTLALLSGGLTVYIGVGLWLEERDLVRRFGSAYEAYRRRVPALVPWRRPVPPATYPAVPSE